jgi:hypothetical protein
MGGGVASLRPAVAHAVRSSAAARRPMVHNGFVAELDLVPRRTIGGVIAVWVLAALIGVGIGVFVPLDWRAPWLVVGLGACLIVAFAVQLGYGRSQGFTERVAASVLGALVVLGVLSLGFALAAVVTG